MLFFPSLVSGVKRKDFITQKPVFRARAVGRVSSMEWLRSVKGVILDMCGVLYDSGEGGGQAIHGSVEAVKR